MSSTVAPITSSAAPSTGAASAPSSTSSTTSKPPNRAARRAAATAQRWANASASRPAIQPEAPTAAKEVAAAAKQAGESRAAINGFGGKDIKNTNDVTSLLRRENKYQASYSGSGGFDRIEAKPIAGGFEVACEVHTQDGKDKITLMLMAEAYDPKTNELRPVLLTFLQHAEPMGNKQATKTFRVSYEDIAAFLKAEAPGSDLQIVPGITPMFIAAQWYDTGHRAGGPGEGTFIAPIPLGSVQAGNAQRISASGAKVAAENIPLDKAVKFNQQLVSGWDNKINELKAILELNGQFESRVEQESKLVIDTKENWAAAINTFFAVADDKAKSKELMGAGWEVVTADAKTDLKRFWTKSDATKQGQPGVEGTGKFAGFRVDPATGWPIVSSYSDKYSDDAKLTFTTSGGSVRIRTDEHKTAINIKHGGMLDAESHIRIRPEYGIPVKKGTTMQQMVKVLQILGEKPPTGRFYHTVYNTANREMAAAGVDVAEVVKGFKELFDVEQKRYKFKLKHTSGLEMEVSLDEVTATTKRPEHNGKDGKPQTVTFYCMEVEIDHLQINSTNVMDNPSAAKATVMLSEKEQKDWLGKLAKGATLNIEPTLHTKEEWSNKGLVETDSFVAAAAGIARIMKNAFPKGTVLTDGEPKPTHAAQALGII